MTDRNGKDVKLGDKVRLVLGKERDHCGLNGLVGEVRAIKAETLFDRKERARVADGDPLSPNFSSWCLPEEIELV